MKLGERAGDFLGSDVRGSKPNFLLFRVLSAGGLVLASWHEDHLVFQLEGELLVRFRHSRGVVVAYLRLRVFAPLLVDDIRDAHQRAIQTHHGVTLWDDVFNGLLWHWVPLLV